MSAIFSSRAAKNHRDLSPHIPSWVVVLQAFLFAILYAIWALPETILVRHICLISGALLSLWTIWQYRHKFFQRRAIPFWLIVTLFAWATFHLLFLSNNFAAQYEEYTSIWKRTALGAIFALGFGIALSCHSKKKGSIESFLWALMYIGLLAPTFIYIVKYVLSNYGAQKGWVFPDYWRLYYDPLPFYIPKTVYVCFCLPTLGIALGQFARNIHQNQVFKWANLAYLGTIPSVLFVFYAENIKNGVIYSAALLALFLGVLIFRNFRRHFLIKLVILGLVLTVASFFVANSIQKNASWGTLKADARIAIDTQTFPQWKYGGERGYPKNEFGSMVSITNYERLAWGKIGIELVTQTPLGYGLVERSFGHLAKINWPDSKLHQSHSGWIDLALGLGIPGIVLILSSMMILFYQLSRLDKDASNSQNLYLTTAWWGLFSLLLMWCTTEISQKVFFDDLIFWLSLGSGICLWQADQLINFGARVKSESPVI